MTKKEISNKYTLSKIDKEAEIYLIGSQLKAETLSDYLFENIENMDFWNAQMGCLFSTMQRVWKKGQEISIDSLNAESELPIDFDLLEEIINRTPDNIDISQYVDRLKSSVANRDKSFGEFIVEYNQPIIWDFYSQIQYKNDGSLYKEWRFTYEITAEDASVMADFRPGSLELMNNDALTTLKRELIEYVCKKIGINESNYTIFVVSN